MTAPGEPTPACHRQAEAGAYLLGALSPADRADYAVHLESCPHCLREVGQLAGLPGLLARAAQTLPEPSPVAAREAGGARPPDSADPLADPVADALREVRRVRRGRRMLVAAGFVVLALLGLGGSLVAGRLAGTGAAVTGVSAAAELPVRMQPVGNPPVSAAVSVTVRPWGSEVVMRCRYAGKAQSPVYVLVARAADGSTSELARWSAVADQDVVLASATELAGPRLAELEVRNAAGAVVLRAEQPS